MAEIAMKESDQGVLLEETNPKQEEGLQQRAS
jgi:hypothetical protein